MPTPLTRSTFRPTVPGATVRSNFPSGIGMNDQYKPKTPLTMPGTGQGYGTGMGYGTGQSAAAPVTPAAAPVAAPIAAVAGARPTTPVKPVMTPNRTTPNAGGTITRNLAPGVKAVTKYAPSPYNPSPNRPNMGGTMTRNGKTTVVPPSPSGLATPAEPVASPTTEAAPQTESNNPLTGDDNAQPGGTTDQIDPGSALGLKQRGASTPKGTDALPESKGGLGGTGIYARQFANPRAADLYGSYVKKIFG